jgi:hypothetical protein
MRPRRAFPECPNCGASTPDAYCSSCGQRNLDLHESVRALLGDAVEEALGADSRILRTLRALVLQPGLISREYRQGRRARYTSPWKVYLAAAAVRIVASRRAVLSHLDASASPLALRPSDLASLRTLFSGLGAPAERLTAALDRMASSDSATAIPAQHAFYDRMQSFYTTAFALMLPAFALALMALYRRDRFVIDHLVFLLYWQAAVFLCETLASWIPQVGVAAFVGFALSAVYSLLALRTMYGESVPRTLVKGAIFGASVFAITVAGMLALMTLALLSM